MDSRALCALCCASLYMSSRTWKLLLRVAMSTARSSRLVEILLTVNRLDRPVQPLPLGPQLQLHVVHAAAAGELRLAL